MKILTKILLTTPLTVYGLIASIIISNTMQLNITFLTFIVVDDVYNQKL